MVFWWNQVILFKSIFEEEMMRKKIFVKSVVKQEFRNSYRYVRVQIFVTKLIEHGITVKSVQPMSRYSSDEYWHKIILSYKYKERKEFEKKYNSIITDSDITKWFNIADKIPEIW